VAVGGDFDAISLYSYVNQREGLQGNGTQSVLHQLPNGMYDVLAATDANIEDMCTFTLKNGTLVGVVIGGNFTSVGGIGAQSIAFIDGRTSAIIPAPGIQGTVNALLCDSDTQTVYVGGAFEAADSANAIAWLASGSWANLPFAGFDAPVTSIIKAPNGHIVFGGSFNGLKNVSSTTIDSQRPGEIINLDSAAITSVANTTSGSQIVCTSNNSASQPWQLQDNTAGSWTASMRYGFEPSVLRLRNANVSGKGVKTWRFTALPNTGIMNFTYTDPVTGNQAHCDATCPLAQNSSLPYQDFYFVNRVGMNSFRIDVSAWYGQGGALDGIEIFQTDTFVYAIESFNEPSCLASSTSISRVTTTGPWYETPSRDSVADYLSIAVSPTTVNTTKIVFEPDIDGSGNFVVVVYTPGCIQDSSCSTRGSVNVTGTLTSDGGSTFSTILSQTNDYEKYDQVYQGKIDPASGSFEPAVTITPSGGLPTQLVVASRVRFSGNPSTGGLRGLFDFDPNSAVVDTNFTDSAINNAGTKLNANAQVSALTTHGDTIYSAGSFSDDIFENIMSFANNSAQSLPNGGLNAPVADLYSSNDTLYVGGSFTGTSQNGSSGLQNVAAYRYADQVWVALGAGVDGPVTEIVPFQLNTTNNQPETVIGFTGSFSHIHATGTSAQRSADGFAVWVPSQSNWLQNTGLAQQLLAGMLCSYTTLPNQTWLGAGTLVSLGQSLSDIVGLEQSNNGIGPQQLPIKIEATTPTVSSSVSKRALLSQQNITGVVAGAYDTSDGRDNTILGGHFTASTNTSTVQNLAFLDRSHGNSVSGLPSGIHDNSTFMALALQNDILFAGGLITGKINNTQVQGVILYDMSTRSYRSPQPAALEGGDAMVNSIVTQPATSNVYVGGSFERTAQGLACSSVCVYDTSSNLWSSAGGGLSGTVTALHFVENGQLIAAGNLSVSGNSTSLAQYDTKAQSWSVFASVPLPGPVNAFAGTSEDNEFWVAGTSQANGTTYLVKIADGNLIPASGLFDAGTTILGIQVVSLSKNHGSSRYFDSDNMDLLVMGSLNITGFGHASAALFNGSTITPFMLSVDSTGQPGSISTLFSSKVNPAIVNRKYSFYIIVDRTLTNANRQIWPFSWHRNPGRALRSLGHNLLNHRCGDDSQPNSKETSRIQHSTECPIPG